MGFMDIVKGAGKMGLDSLSPVQTFKAGKNMWDIAQSGGDPQELRRIALKGLDIDEDELKADVQDEAEQHDVSEGVGRDASSLKGVAGLGDTDGVAKGMAGIGASFADFDSGSSATLQQAISQNLAMMDQSEYPASKSVMSGMDSAEQTTPAFDDNEMEA